MRTRKANLRYRLTVLIVLAGLLTIILTSYSPLSLATGEARMPSPPTDKVGAVAASQSESSFPDRLMPVGANQAAVSNSKSPIGLGKRAQSYTYSLSPFGAILPDTGGGGGFSVITQPGRQWSASPGAIWISAFGSMSGSFASVNSASFVAPVAPESIVAGFGSGLAATTEEATTIPLPTTLGGRSVKVTDSALVDRLAPLFFVSPTQINYQMPAGTAVGTATVRVIPAGGGSTIAQGNVQVTTVAPGIFAVSGTGNPPTAAGGWLRYSGGDLVGSGDLITPIEFGGPNDIVYIVLYATGLRNRSSLSAVFVTVGGSGTVVEYAGAQGTLIGLDQINAILPRSLIGAGQVNVVVTVDSVAANTVKLTAGT